MAHRLIGAGIQRRRCPECDYWRGLYLTQGRAHLLQTPSRVDRAMQVMMTALTTSASSSSTAWLRVIVQKDEGLRLVDREVEVEIQTAAHTLREKVAALMVMVKIVGVVLRLLDARYFCSILMKYD